MLFVSAKVSQLSLLPQGQPERYMRVQNMVASGVSIAIIFDTVKDMKNGPRSLATFYKIYRQDIVAARAALHEGIGTAIMKKALVDKDSPHQH